MRFLRSLLPSFLLLGANFAEAASSWSFTDATVSMSPKTGATVKDKLTSSTPLGKTVVMEPAGTVKVLLTATEDSKAKRPHQAFLLLKDQDSGLEASFPLLMKESGKGKAEFAEKDLPVQLVAATKPLQATLVLASFGSSQPFSSEVFSLEVKPDRSQPAQRYEKPLRYGQLPEIHHIFKVGETSGPIVISLFFLLAVIATVPVLFGAWVFLGANLSHLSKAMAVAPVSHGLFYGSIAAIEGVFFMYYTSWNLFKTLPVVGIFGIVAFLSGSKALSEVQVRRIAGER